MKSKRLKAPEKAKVTKALEVLGATEDLSKIRHADLVKRITAVVGFDVSLSTIKTQADAHDMTLWARTKPVDVAALAAQVAKDGEAIDLLLDTVPEHGKAGVALEARVAALEETIKAQSGVLHMQALAVKQLKATRITLYNQADKHERALGILIDEVYRIEDASVDLDVSGELKNLPAFNVRHDVPAGLFEAGPDEASQESAGL